MEFVPHAVREDYARVCYLIFTALIESIDKGTSSDENSALRWYAGIPQLFLRECKHKKRRVACIQQRLSEFLAGDYEKIIDDWQLEKTKNLEAKKIKPVKSSRATPTTLDAVAKEQDRRANFAVRLFEKGFVSKSLRMLEGNGTASSADPRIIQQMRDKHPQTKCTLDTSAEGRESSSSISLDLLHDVVMGLKPHTGTSVRKLRTNHIQALFNGNFTSPEAKNAATAFTELGVLYLNGSMPSWMRRLLSISLLTPLNKKPPMEGVLPDGRPINAEDSDTAAWCKACSRQLAPVVRDVVAPQQLAVGISGGTEALVLGNKLMLEEAIRNREEFVVVGTDMKNAHNSFNRVKAQEIIHRVAIATKVPELHQLEVIHSSISGKDTLICIRDDTSDSGFTKLCDCRQGGKQGNSLTNIIFALITSPAMKRTERKFPGVCVRAIQDDITISGHPADVFGNAEEDEEGDGGGALAFLLRELEELDLLPNRDKFQVYGTPNSLSLKPSWLNQTFVTDEHGNKAYGIWICGAALGDNAYIHAKLQEQVQLLCGTGADDAEDHSPGLIKKNVTLLSSINAQVASSAIRLSYSNRFDYLFSTHTPRQMEPFAEVIDSTIRSAYRTTFDCDLLNPAGELINQPDPTLIRDRCLLKTSLGGAGIRPMSHRAPFLNTLNNFFDKIPKLFPSLIPRFGGPESFLPCNSSSRWSAFFESDSVYARTGITH